MPLLTKGGHALGSLFLNYLEQQHIFTRRTSSARREIEVVEGIASQAAMAIENAAPRSGLERARLYEERQREVESKTALLQELHHRVKNSLQMVAGFLSYQLSQADRVPLLDVITTTMDRVKGIAAVHEALSHQEGERVRLRTLVESVLSAIPSPTADGRRPQVVFGG